jgi:prenyltransferase beta subunit
MTNDRVFISYNSHEADTVHDLARRIERATGITCWLDVWSLVPGRAWQEDVEQALRDIPVIIVAIGGSGFGPWQNEEFRGAITLSAGRPRDKRVIPVLLPSMDSGATAYTLLPLFLQRYTLVDLRAGLDSPQFANLVAGIRDVPPRPLARHSPLSASKRHDAIRGQLRAHLSAVCRWAASIQNPDGGLPSDSFGKLSCTWASAGLVYALGTSGHGLGELWLKRTLAWILDSRNHDGGVPIVARGDPSIVDATAQTLLALVLHEGQRGRPRRGEHIAELADWLVGHQHPAGGWAWRSGTEDPWTASTAFALLALHAAQRAHPPNAADIAVALESGTAALVAGQHQDGGWGAHPDAPSHPASTGLAGYALTTLGRTEVSDPAAGYLEATQTPAGRWPSAIDRPTGYSVIRYGDAYGLLGLAAVRSYAESAAVRRGLRGLLKSFQGSHFRYEDTTMETWPTRDGVLALASVAASIAPPVARGRP